MTEPRRSRLAWRVYALNGALALAIMVALLVLPRYTRSARYFEPQASIFQLIVDRWSLKDRAGLEESLARFQTRVRGTFSLYAADGTLLHTMAQPPLDPADDDERAELTTGKWALSTGRIVARSDDRTLIAVYAPHRTGFPWSWVLPIGAVILVVVGGASIWFARRLAIPLDRLADAARRFGAGDVRARAALRRHDELGEVGRAFDDMAERTATMLAVQRRLMADVSHELRTPLSRIRVALELAAEDPVAAKDVLADVSGDLDEIDQLIEDILTTARLDGEQPPINRTPTTIGELVERAAQRFATRHPRRALARELAPTHGAQLLTCDPALLRRALDNLLDNAAKYSDADVRLVVTTTADAIAFEIIDRGIGMTADELAQAFTDHRAGMTACAPRRNTS
ncbi:MAG: HAMP domain-containing sensor histidine kinase [Proteobacteria bacterium]|nr:HAMP domain-containing sensor histidine kinase [Pseudomonadota bacterium]